MRIQHLLILVFAYLIAVGCQLVKFESHAEETENATYSRPAIITLGHLMCEEKSKHTEVTSSAVAIQYVDGAGVIGATKPLKVERISKMRCELTIM